MTKDLIILAVTNLVVIVGWFFLFKQTLSIKRRDEIRKLVELSSATIDEIYLLCQEYYSSDSGDHISYSSTNIKAKFVLLSHYLLLLRNEGVGGEISVALRAFKIFATGGLFETTRFNEQDDVPGWKSELATSAHELKFRIEKGFFDWTHSRSSVTSWKSYTG